MQEFIKVMLDRYLPKQEIGKVDVYITHVSSLEYHPMLQQKQNKTHISKYLPLRGEIF